MSGHTGRRLTVYLKPAAGCNRGGSTFLEVGRLLSFEKRNARRSFDWQEIKTVFSQSLAVCVCTCSCGVNICLEVSVTKALRCQHQLRINEAGLNRGHLMGAGQHEWFTVDSGQNLNWAALLGAVMHWEVSAGRASPFRQKLWSSNKHGHGESKKQAFIRWIVGKVWESETLS